MQTGNPAQFSEAADRARYCELLAARSRLPALQVRRACLAAWLSWIHPLPDSVRQIAREHGIESALLPGDASVAPPTLEAQMLDLVRCYQKERQRPGGVPSLKDVQEKLEAEWARSPDQQVLVRRFVKILRDESFLSETKRTAGRILLVDPEEAVTPVLAAPLSAEGYDVCVAVDVERAEAVLTAEAPLVIVSELNLPIVDGIEFFRRTRENPAWCHIPFVMLTPATSKATARKCVRLGVDEVMTKPVDLEMFVLKLRRFADQARRGGPAAAGAAAGVTGNLRDMTFTDLLQIVSAGGKSMAVAFRAGDRRGEVLVDQGQVVHAVTGDKTGEEAFYDLMRWQEGVFTARPCSEFPARSIQTSVMSLLMEGSRIADEDRAVGSAPPASSGRSPLSNPA